MSRFWDIVFGIPLLFRRHVCLSNLKHAPSRELPLTNCKLCSATNLGEGGVNKVYYDSVMVKVKTIIDRLVTWLKTTNNAARTSQMLINFLQVSGPVEFIMCPLFK